MANWTSKTAGSKNPVALGDRPAPVSIYQNNITVEGSWVEPLTINPQNGRTISNVTLAMPHAGIVAAAALKDNKLLQVASKDSGPGTNVSSATLS